ncbi:hypothetical protein TL16_g01255 [Triparma laevis f. inornata]|uniref:Uncharacterized protein n=1 Tax=Triparma laevis f. inornata TaxID=1714386 RepID=A0A9W6ZLA2_9STRA|nr:hypothetical protein TL16_g01255 [Triparma laevis f. inornata]
MSVTLPPMSAVREAKVVFLGSSGVGKTSLVRSFVTSTFTPHQETTIGASYLSKIMRLETQNCTSCGETPRPTSDIIKFNVWDTAGQEKYESLAQMYYRHCDAAVIVFSVKDRSSYLKAQQWVDTLKDNVDGEDCVVIVCGNKRDLLRGRDEPDDEFVERPVPTLEVEVRILTQESK